MKQDIQNLSVEGLCALFDEPAAPTKTELKRRKKEQKSRAFEELKSALHQCAEEINHWTPTALGVVFYETKCNHCGKESTHPELHYKDEALVRFTHRITKKEIWQRTPFGQIPKDLEEHVITLSARTNRCMSCVRPVYGLDSTQVEELSLLPQPSGVSIWPSNEPHPERSKKYLGTWTISIPKFPSFASNSSNSCSGMHA